MYSFSSYHAYILSYSENKFNIHIQNSFEGYLKYSLIHKRSHLLCLAIQSLPSWLFSDAPLETPWASLLVICLLQLFQAGAWMSHRRSQTAFWTCLIRIHVETLQGACMALAASLSKCTIFSGVAIHNLLKGYHRIETLISDCKFKIGWKLYYRIEILISRIESLTSHRGSCIRSQS